MAQPRDGLGVIAGGQDTRPLASRGYIRFRAALNFTIGLVAELDGPVTTIGGYATHDIASRPGREGIASYAGREPLRLRIPLLFDRDRDRGTVEPEIKMLERMMGVGETRPPQLVIDGFGVPHGAQREPRLRWELDGDPEWGEDIRHRENGNRCYVPVVVTAVRVDTPSTLTQPNQPAQGELAAVRQIFVVPKTGHPRSLKGIAKKFGTTWKALRQLNPKLNGDPDVGLKAGTKVRVY